MENNSGRNSRGPDRTESPAKGNDAECVVSKISGKGLTSVPTLERVAPASDSPTDFFPEEISFSGSPNNLRCV